jgi:hypothetical protein
MIPGNEFQLHTRTNYERLTAEAKRLDDKLARYMTANGIDLDDVKAEIENKTCRLPARVREYVVAYFTVNEYENKRASKPE